MDNPEPRIVDFISEHHILTLAVCRDNIPWCATCFYVYLKDENRFVFTSDPETRHIRDIMDVTQSRVAGTIALETRIIGKIRGIQFTGLMRLMDDQELKRAKSAYLKKFPIARLMSTLNLWCLEPDYIKMTDNRLGFGKKLIWTAGLRET
jgi:hypothetical protein